MDYYFFFYISEKYLQFTKKHLLRKMFDSAHTSAGQMFVCKLCISQRYLINLERNWKYSVCISVKNFGNL